MANGGRALRTKKLKGTASDKEISFSNDNEQLNKIPVIVNGFTTHSDIFEVPTVLQINKTENYSDMVIIDNNINSRCKDSAQNELTVTVTGTVTVTVTVTVINLISHCWWRHTAECASKIKDILNKNFIVTAYTIWHKTGFFPIEGHRITL